jgi:hypothetical protein
MIDFSGTGRMISLSKSQYLAAHPDHVVVFNASICAVSGKKIWWGDLDLTIDEKELQRLANERGEEIFILREQDGRFANEHAPLLAHAVRHYIPEVSNA